MLDALKERDRRRDHLHRELATLDELAQVGDVDLAKLREQLHRILANWRALFTGHPQQARQILAKVLNGRLRFIPREDAAGRYYEFTGEGRFGPVLTGTVVPRTLVTPAGFGSGGVRQVRGIMRVA